MLEILEPVLHNPWQYRAVWVVCVLIYAINHVLVCMRPEMAVKFRFTK